MYDDLVLRRDVVWSCGDLQDALRLQTPSGFVCRRHDVRSRKIQLIDRPLSRVISATGDLKLVDVITQE